MRKHKKNIFYLKENKKSYFLVKKREKNLGGSTLSHSGGSPPPPTGGRGGLSFGRLPKDQGRESMEDADFPPENEPQYKFSSQTPLMGGVIYPPPQHVSGVKKIF